MKAYVLGFIFNRNLREVILLKKRVPATYTGEGRLKFQDGKINGVGGLIQDNESPVDAMIRKAQAETNIRVEASDWKQYAELHFDDSIVSVFACKVTDDQFYSMKQVTDEQCRQIPVAQVPYNDVLSNLLWLVPLAIDSINDPFNELMVQVTYRSQEQTLEDAKADGQAFAPEEVGYHADGLRRSVRGNVLVDQSEPGATTVSTGGGTTENSTSLPAGGQNKDEGVTSENQKDAAPVLDPAKVVDHYKNIVSADTNAADAGTKVVNETTRNEANPNGVKTQSDNKPSADPKRK